MLDTASAWIIAGVIIAGFSLASTIRNKEGFIRFIGNFFVIVKWSLITWISWIIFSALVIDGIFNSSPLSCQVGLHPYAHLPDVTDLTAQFAWISSPCTLSGKLLPFAIIGLAILSGYKGMKQKLDS